MQKRGAIYTREFDPSREEALQPEAQVIEVFQRRRRPFEDAINILVRLPEGESIESRACGGPVIRVPSLRLSPPIDPKRKAQTEDLDESANIDPVLLFFADRRNHFDEGMLERNQITLDEDVPSFIVRIKKELQAQTCRFQNHLRGM